MPQAFYILFGAVFTVAVAALLGKMMLRGLGLRFYREEEHVLAFLAGAPVLSLLVFTACALGAARKGVFLALGAAVLALAFRTGAHRPRGDRLPALPRFWKRLFLLVCGVYFVLYFSNAMAPELSPDGCTYHLGIIARYLRHHGFYRITTNMYANLSQGVEMLFLFAFAFGRHSAAALVHFAFLLALPMAMLSWALRWGFGRAGAVAALFVFVSPVVGIDGSSAYIDVAVAAIAFGVFYLLQIWDAERAPALLIPIGLLAGFGYAAKYTAFLAVPYALGFVAWKTWRKRAPLVRPLLVVASCAAIPMLPWIVKNWLWLGNPFSPFFNGVFPNPYVTVGFEREYTAYFRMYDLASRWQIPWSATVRGDLSGILGPLFLLAPVALIALRWRAGRQLLLAVIPFGLPYFGNIGARFLIPVLPFVALAMALVLTRVPAVAVALVAVHAFLSWPNVIPRYANEDTWRLVKVTWREALRIKDEDGFLHSNLLNYDITRVIERTVPPGEKVLAFSPVADAYTSRDVLTAYQSASNLVSGGILWTPMMEDVPPLWQLRFGFPARALRRVRVVQTARGEPDKWSIAEFRAFHRGRELPRAPEWRLRASPNPWDVQMAFDNSPVTRWSSAQAIYPGMSVEVDFGRLETADAVLLECSHDQWKIRLRLEGQDAAGRWVPLAAEPEAQDRPPIMGLRRAATDELKLRGIRYLLVYDTDFGASDFRKKAVLWNIELAGEAPGARLYRIL